jgi:hypothetical protein
MLAARPLRPAEQAEVSGLLAPGLRRLFWDQPDADQRHALECARAVAAAAPGRPELVEAALLHDVGKRRSGLGVVGRVVASVLGMAGVARRGRVRAYLEHGPRGAAELAAAGAAPLTVAYARHHHAATPPAGVDPADWAVLRAADGE